MVTVGVGRTSAKRKALRPRSFLGDAGSVSESCPSTCSHHELDRLEGRGGGGRGTYDPSRVLPPGHHRFN